MDAERVWLAYVSRNGFVAIWPTGPAWGKAAVILDRFRLGFTRSEYVLDGKQKFQKWTFQIGRKEFKIDPLGEEISEEVFDPPENRVTRQVVFEGETYTYHSGKRVSYWKNFPETKVEIPLWMPDEKHKDNMGIVSMGITKGDGTVIDIVETLKVVNGLRLDLDDKLTKLKKDE